MSLTGPESPEAELGLLPEAIGWNDRSSNKALCI